MGLFRWDLTALRLSCRTRRDLKGFHHGQLHNRRGARMHGQKGEHQEHVRDRPRRPRQVHSHRLPRRQGWYHRRRQGRRSSSRLSRGLLRTSTSLSPPTLTTTVRWELSEWTSTTALLASAPGCTDGLSP